MKNNKGISIVACIIIILFVIILIAFISIGSKAIKAIDEGVKDEGQLPYLNNSTENEWK